MSRKKQPETPCTPVLVERNYGDPYATCWHVAPPARGVVAYTVMQERWDEKYNTRHIMEWKAVR